MADQLLSSDPKWGATAAPPTPTEDLLRQAHEAAAKGDMEGANAAFFQIPAEDRKARGLYAGPGGGDATGKGVDALTGALALGSIGRAIGGGATLGGKVVAGAKEAVTQAAPLVKYEATKGMLVAMGGPAGMAEPIALVVSGLRKKNGTANGSVATAAPADAAVAGGLTAVEEAQLLKQGYTPAMIAKIRVAAAKPPTPAARPADAPPETSPVAAAPTPPPAAASAPPPAPGPARALTAEEAQAVEGLVQRGYPREAVLAELERQRPAAAAAPTPAKPMLLAAETNEYLRLITKAKKTPQEAMAMIEAQRALTKKLGLPSSEATRQSVVDRNATGRWKDDQ